jgi:hypothetical protein
LIDFPSVAVHGKLQQQVCAGLGCHATHWVDLRTGRNDDTSTGDNGSEIRRCNYDVTENLSVRVCETRSCGGVQYGSWYCGNETQS